MPNFISEDQIEKAAVVLLKEQYGYRTVNCFTQDVEDPVHFGNRQRSRPRSKRQDGFLISALLNNAAICRIENSSAIVDISMMKDDQLSPCSYSNAFTVTFTLSATGSVRCTFVPTATAQTVSCPLARRFSK